MTTKRILERREVVLGILREYIANQIIGCDLRLGHLLLELAKHDQIIGHNEIGTILTILADEGTITRITKQRITKPSPKPPTPAAPMVFLSSWEDMVAQIIDLQTRLGRLETELGVKVS